MERLKLEERILLANYRAIKMPFKEIGKRLGRDQGALCREYNRNKQRNGKYNPILADKMAHSRQKLKGKPPKIENNPKLQFYIIQKLALKWSPEQISGTIKKEGVFENVSHETIYQFIYSETGKTNLFHYLRSKRKQRLKRCFRKPSTSKIRFRVSIDERPKFINDKSTLGHWESDSVEFSNKKAYLSVQYERKSQFVSIHKVKDKSALSTLHALQDTVNSFFVQTITFDNGTEGAFHYKLKLPTYFCDPYCSWQKGGVENINKLIRQYLPRNTKIQDISHKHIQFIQDQLNNRPRKSLNFLSPLQFISSSNNNSNPSSSNNIALSP